MNKWNFSFADRVAIPRLQCPVDVCNGVRNDDLSSGVYVPRDTIVTHVHELRGTVVACTYTICYRNTRYFFIVQNEL